MRGGGNGAAAYSWCILRLSDFRNVRWVCSPAALLTARWLMLRLTEDCCGRFRGRKEDGLVVSASDGRSGRLRGLAS